MSIARIISFRGLGYNTYNKETYATGVTGTSDCNDYIPVFALWKHLFLKIENTEIGIMEYTLPIASIAQPLRNYIRMVQILIYGTSSPLRGVFKLAGENQYVNLERGLVYNDQGEILMCLAINKEYLLSVSRSELESGVAPSTAFLLFTTDALDRGVYKTFKKKLQEHYIGLAQSLKIDIVRTSRVNEWLFKNNVEKKEFKSIQEMKEHVGSLPEKIL